jgi:O-methyltransferase
MEPSISPERPARAKAPAGLGNRLARKARNMAALSRRPRPAEARGMYLDLLEKALLHTLYDPPDTQPMPDFSNEAFREAMEREAAGKPVAKIDPAATRAMGRDWPVYAQTMIGVKRLRNLRRCIQEVLADGVPGDLIEAGCWRGGAAIMMRGTLKAHGARGRTVFAADSFAGVPAPDPERYPEDAGDLNYTADALAVPLEDVKANFERYGLLDENVRFLEGLFKDTLPTVRDNTWAVVRLDGDLYESTKDGLENLYPGLSAGGFMIIDDFGWDNCRRAVEDFRREHDITDPIERIDWVGAYWRRSA